jgi:hypothetical protein
VLGVRNRFNPTGCHAQNLAGSERCSPRCSGVQLPGQPDTLRRSPASVVPPGPCLPPKPRRGSRRAAASPCTSWPVTAGWFGGPANGRPSTAPAPAGQSRATERGSPARRRTPSKTGTGVSLFAGWHPGTE